MIESLFGTPPLSGSSTMPSLAIILSTMNSEVAKPSPPRFIAGTVSPIGTDRHPVPQAEPLLPPDIKRISRSIEISDYTPEGVNEAIEKRYWPCVDALVE